MFESARLKLTAFYVGLLLLITGGLSVVFFHNAAEVLEKQHQRFEVRFRANGRPVKLPPQVMEEELDEAKGQLLRRLVLLNLVLAVGVGGASYWLSGVTLAPIRRALERERRFVADASHELRTPLTALKTSLEVSASDKKLSKYAKGLMAESLEDVNGLVLLVNRLLRLAREGGSVAHKKVEVARLVKRVVRRMKPLAQEAGVELGERKAEGLLMVMGDETSLEEVVTELLANAIKYSEKGGEVEVSVRREAKWVVIEVRDEGVGIAASDLSEVFERFYQSDRARTRNGGGVGLGLSVVKQIVEEHGGKVEVESEEGKGSVFEVRLPKV